MNREIKFRFWDDRILKMRSGLTIPAATSYYSALDTQPMQYTGLKDKNGIEIYEGDILGYFNKDSEPTDLTKVVKWEQQTCSFCAAGRLCSWNEVVVLGNIYQNPELLEASND